MIEVKLSRRNILSLLHKLHMPGSARTIIKPVGDIDVAVIVEPDDEHYGNRVPGPMHPETERFVKAVETAIRNLEKS